MEQEFGRHGASHLERNDLMCLADLVRMESKAVVCLCVMSAFKHGQGGGT
jgi:hypothetical protein